VGRLDEWQEQVKTQSAKIKDETQGRAAAEHYHQFPSVILVPWCLVGSSGEL
jgi:hypothetical protein